MFDGKIGRLKNWVKMYKNWPSIGIQEMLKQLTDTNVVFMKMTYYVLFTLLGIEKLLWEISNKAFRLLLFSRHHFIIKKIETFS